MEGYYDNLKGRTAVVTGGSGVLCRTMAKALAEWGVNIAILNRTVEKGREAAEEICRAGGNAIAVPCDVLNQEQVQQAANKVFETYGPCHILINGAGGGHPKGNTTNETFREADLHNSETTTFFDMSVAGFREVVDLNLLGTWIPSQIFGKQMLGMHGATIINISSMASARPATKVPAYSAAKSAIDNLTQWLAVYLADAGIRVNAIAPGFFVTDQNRRLLLHEDGTMTKRAKKIISHTPMRRFGPSGRINRSIIVVSE